MLATWELTLGDKHIVGAPINLEGAEDACNVGMVVGRQAHRGTIYQPGGPEDACSVGVDARRQAHRWIITVIVS